MTTSTGKTAIRSKKIDNHFSHAKAEILRMATWFVLILP
jgi:hypothetical protein